MGLQGNPYAFLKNNYLQDTRQSPSVSSLRNTQTQNSVFPEIEIPLFV